MDRNFYDRAQATDIYNSTDKISHKHTKATKEFLILNTSDLYISKY